MAVPPVSPDLVSAAFAASAANAASAAADAGDWNTLFAAVVGRVRCSAGPNASPALLECAMALEQLHAQWQGHERQVQQELAETRLALARAQQDLAGTRAGERRARHDAQHDSLTQLPNRSFFRSRLDDALNPFAGAPASCTTQPTPSTPTTTPRLAVLFLDLDDFKPINDRHGHATGDKMLRIVADRLSRSVRSGDMVCRIGGDEFACLLSSPMEREQLRHLAAKLFDAVSAPLKIGALELSVRPSIGIAVAPTDGKTASTLLQRADIAMYSAKRRQSGYAFFDRRAEA